MESFTCSWIKIVAYQVIVQQRSWRSLQPRLPGHSSRWRTEQRRSLCGQNSPQSCRIWQRWPQCRPWLLRLCWGCRWKRESWGSADHSCWSRCWSGSSQSSYSCSNACRETQLNTAQEASKVRLQRLYIESNSEQQWDVNTDQIWEHML